MATTLGYKLIAGLLASEKGVQEFLKMNLNDELFTEGEGEVFDYVEQHVMKYGVLPQTETVEKEVGVSMPEAPEPPEYYLQHVENRQLHRGMKVVMQEAKDILNNDNPQVALDLISDFVLKATLHKNRKEIVNFTAEAHGILVKDYKNHLLLGDEYGIRLGWPEIDDMVGGLLPGDFLAIVGRPAAGKTYKVLYMAHNAWWEQKKKPLVVSMEMKPLPLIQRIAAMHHKVPITKLKKAELTTKTWNKMKGDLSKLYEFELPFWIVDGNLTATVKDVILLARQLRPDVVYVDGAYLLRHPNPKASNWERVKDNAEALKQQLAGELGIPVVASYQFNREAAKKTMDATGLEHIGGSDAIGQIATIVLGLFEPDSVETLNQKHVDIMKGRNGEMGGFDVNWIFDDYPFMDFSQVPEKSKDDLSFI